MYISRGIRRDLFMSWQKKYAPEVFTHMDPGYFQVLRDLFDKRLNRPIVGIVPRGSGKSKFVLYEVIRRLVMKKEMFIVVKTYNQEEAREFIRKVKTVLTTNTDLIRDYGELYSESMPSSETELFLKNGTVLWARSWQHPICGTTFRSYRPSLIIYDDVERIPISENSIFRNELRDSFFTEAMPTLQPPHRGGGTLCILGTPYCDKTILYDMYMHPMAQGLVVHALRGEPFRIRALLEFVDMFADEISFDTEKLDQVEWLVQNIESYWPDRHSVYGICEMAAILGQERFEREIMIKPIDMEE